MDDLEQLLKSNNVFIGDDKGSKFVVRCINPEHADVNPSMHIGKRTGAFYCFSCGYKGNIFKHYGVAEPSKVSVLTDKCLNMITEINKPASLEFPEDADFSDFAYRGISADILTQAQMFTSSIIKDSVIFPLRDFERNITAFLGRNTDPTHENKTKYMIYPRHAKVSVYPLYGLEGAKEVFICEGIFDLLSLYDIGVKNVLCILGVDNFNFKVLDTLKILGVNTIISLLDNDDAGNKASEKVKNLCESNYVAFHRPEMPFGFKDINEMDRKTRKDLIENCRNRSKKE